MTADNPTSVGASVVDDIERLVALTIPRLDAAHEALALYDAGLEYVDAQVKAGSRRGNVYYDHMSKVAREMAAVLRKAMES